MNETIKPLVRLANRLDALGLVEYADRIDELLKFGRWNLREELERITGEAFVRRLANLMVDWKWYDTVDHAMSESKMMASKLSSLLNPAGYGDLVPEDVSEDFKGECAIWFRNLWLSWVIKQRDIPKDMEFCAGFTADPDYHMETFFKCRQFVPPNKRMLSQISTPQELMQIADDAAMAQDAAASKAAIKGRGKAFEQKALADTKVLNETDEWKVLIPQSKEAAIYWGSGTRWCTSTTGEDNYFDFYTNQGPLCIFLNKQTGEKLQWHLQSGQFKDLKDREIGYEKSKPLFSLLGKTLGAVSKIEHSTSFDNCNFAEVLEIIDSHPELLTDGWEVITPDSKNDIANRILLHVFNGGQLTQNQTKFLQKAAPQKIIDQVGSQFLQDPKPTWGALAAFLGLGQQHYDRFKKFYERGAIQGVGQYILREDRSIVAIPKFIIGIESGRSQPVAVFDRSVSFALANELEDVGYEFEVWEFDSSSADSEDKQE